MEADAAKVRNFVEMGFSEARSKKALVHFKNNFESAMAYMLNNDEQRDATMFAADAPLQPRSLLGPQSAPNSDALKTLLEMGYQREDAAVALRVTDNNVEAACTFLINNPNPSLTMPGVQVMGGGSREAQIGYAT